MKTLYLIRHAKSSWDDPSLADIDRPLNKRGERNAPNMARRLKEKDILIDRMITSPANRAYTTCKIFADILRVDESKIEIRKELYHAGEDTLLAVLKNLPDFISTVLIFGHNPGFTDFANELMNERIGNIPTCGVVGCTLPITSWQEISWGMGKLFLNDFPKRKN